METPKPTVHSIDEASDADVTAQAVDLILTTMTPLQLLALAEECSIVSRRGFGRVVGEWRHGKPALLFNERSRNWR